jgi:hypothetical protein
MTASRSSFTRCTNSSLARWRMAGSLCSVSCSRRKLVRAATGTVVLDATAGSDAGIDIVSSEYATVAAEQTALENLADTVADQIVARLALYASRTKPAQ